jgi:hypothetical protein
VAGSSFTGNSISSTGGFGGAIENLLGAMTVSDCTIESNNAPFGGGIDNDFGTLTVSGCDIESNSAQHGGGIYTESGGTTNVTGSFVRLNSPDDTHTDPGSTLNVFNSTIGVET